MLRLNRRQRAVLLDKLADAANIAAGALVFGQFLGSEPFAPALTSFGVGAWAALLSWSLFLATEDES